MKATYSKVLLVGTHILQVINHLVTMYHANTGQTVVLLVIVFQYVHRTKAILFL